MKNQKRYALTWEAYKQGTKKTFSGSTGANPTLAGASELSSFSDLHVFFDFF
jgi:hypothetical protein